MHSLQTKNTLLTVCAIVVTLLVATVIGVVVVRDIGNDGSEQMMRLLCETGKRNLDSYLESVEQSVGVVSSYAKEDLTETPVEQLDEHVERMRGIFAKAADRTHGVLTYYYRIDPEVSATVKGFWYVDLNGNGFVEHEVTDITLYDTADMGALVWFTVPRSTGNPIWLPPYVTDNLDVRVISYNVPVYKGDAFIGVIGIEIDYSMMAEQVNNLTLYENGYAFVTDVDGKVIYHPHVDVVDAETPLFAPDGLFDNEKVFRYRYEGMKKEAVWLSLSNGARLVVAVPLSEVNGKWKELIGEIVIAASVLLLVFVCLTVWLTKRLTKPLCDLTQAAKELNEGNYDVKLDYKGNDEIGILTTTVNRLIGNLKGYIGDLNSLAYGDALTSVRNKSAFDIHAREIQTRIDDPDDVPEFAVGIFDCDDLKDINDRFGHEKGDTYLKNSSHLICRVFEHSAVYRVGGDEFAVILQNEDYRRREELARYFAEKSAEISALSSEDWEKIRVACGIAAYDPAVDRTVEDVMRRADARMYEDKRKRKAGR